MKKVILPVILSTVFLALLKQAYGEDFNLRLTRTELSDSNVEKILEVINTQTGQNLTVNDLLLLEARPLATSYFKMYAQMAAGVPMSGKNIRIWNNLETSELIQAEVILDLEENAANLESKFNKAKFSQKALSSHKLAVHTFKMAQEIVKNHPDDQMIMDAKSSDSWKNGDLVRTIEIKARRGKHFVDISLLNNFVIDARYEEFPQADQYLSLKANVYPIYEEAEKTHEILPKIEAELKYINTTLPSTETDPYESLRNRRWVETMYNPILAETTEGRSQGYWSGPMLKRLAASLVADLPRVDNDFNKGVILDGKYTTINLHPDVLTKFPNINFKPKAGTRFYPIWKQGEDGLWEVKPNSGLLGKIVESQEELLSRPATRDPQHNPELYINEGFDEIQVYWAVTEFMESLARMGLTDPELSTRPFSSFLYDPDIGMRDNAYYTDDTINFTTYSPASGNAARDNGTIWHELGHGIMDRLMGDYVKLADTGGLSEGMADFLASLVVQDVMKDQVYPGSQDFRIINNVGFALTNEVHDDGEAYGGSMKDMLNKALELFGAELGLAKMTDLTLEAMRLTRNHPALTAQDWFSHMQFADSLGSDVRAPGEFKILITDALASRNFSWNEEDAKAELKVTYDDNELNDHDLGYRENPIRLNLAADEKVSYDLKVKLKSVPHYKFVYPVTVKVDFKDGALQGAVKWDNQENNPLVFTLNSEEELVNFKLGASGTCDYVNQPDGSCKDYAYIQIFNNGMDKKPVAKKRFYLKIKTK